MANRLTTNDEWDHCKKWEGGCQNSTIRSRRILETRVKDRRCRVNGGRSCAVGGRQCTSLITLGSWCTRRVRSHAHRLGVIIARGRKMARRYAYCAQWSLSQTTRGRGLRACSARRGLGFFQSYRVCYPVDLTGDRGVTTGLLSRVRLFLLH